MRKLALWYKEGVNELPVDNAKANEWWKKVEVVGWKEMAERGDAGAMCALGYVYSKGSHGETKDDAEAHRLYEKASDAGSVEATALKGFNEVHGIGTPKNIGSGIILLASAATKGSDFACFCIGKYYYFGRASAGIKKDLKKAKYWLRLAVGGSHHKHLGEKNIRKARKWISDIEGGDSSSSSSSSSSGSDDEGGDNGDDGAEAELLLEEE